MARLTDVCCRRGDPARAGYIADQYFTMWSALTNEERERSLDTITTALEIGMASTVALF